MNVRGNVIAKYFHKNGNNVKFKFIIRNQLFFINNYDYYFNCLIMTLPDHNHYVLLNFTFGKNTVDVKYILY